MLMNRPAAPQAETPPKIYLPLRPVMSMREAGTALLIALLVAIAVGAIGGYFQWSAIREDGLLESKGVRVEGQVVDLDVVHNKGGTVYSVNYSFSPGGDPATAQSFMKWETTSREIYDSLRIGGPIQIIVVPDAPRIARIAAQYWPGSVSFWPLGLGGAAALIGLLVAWGYQREYDRARRLDQEGTVAAAVVLDLFVDQRNQKHYVAYGIPGKNPVYHSVDKQVYERLKIGDPVSLWYMPKDPRIFRPKWEGEP